MIEGSSGKASTGRPGWGTWLYSKRESLWYVLVFIIPYLAYKILISTNEAVHNFESTGQFIYPGGYVAVGSITLLLCGLVPLLLKDSQSEFRLGGIILTSVIPGLVTAWVWIGMVRFVENEQAYKTSDPIGHHFVTRRAYNVYKKTYLDADGHKAIAQSGNGAWAWTSGHPTAMKAAEVALVDCMDKTESQHPCNITILDDQWIEPLEGAGLLRAN